MKDSLRTFKKRIISEQVYWAIPIASLIDITLEWIASDYLLSWCEIDTILISQTEETNFSFFTSVSRSFQTFLKVPNDLCDFNVSHILCINSKLSCSLQNGAHTFILRRHWSTLLWHHEWGIPGDKILIKGTGVLCELRCINDVWGSTGLYNALIYLEPSPKCANYADTDFILWKVLSQSEGSSSFSLSQSPFTSCFCACSLCVVSSQGGPGRGLTALAADCCSPARPAWVYCDCAEHIRSGTESWRKTKICP